MAKTEVATTVEDPSLLPAYLAGVTDTSTDNFDQSDMIIPKIKLLQGLSKECEQFAAAKPGEFWHTGFDTPLGPVIKFVVCDRRKKYLLSAPMEDPQGILARADDFLHWDRLGKWSVKLKGQKVPVTWEITNRNVKESGLAEWGTYDPADSDSPPAATLFYDYLVLLPDYPEFGPCVLSLARSQIKAAKKGLNDKIQLHKNNGRPMQAAMFTARAVDDRNGVGQEFKNILFGGAGFVHDPALFQQAMQYNGVLKMATIPDETEYDEAVDSGAANETKF